MDKQFNTPNPTEKVLFGIKYITTKTPKFAVRLGIAFSAMSAFGIATQYMMDTSPEWGKWMAILGVIGVGLSSLFGKK